jgi:dUTP pyrophosphatase
LYISKNMEPSKLLVKRLSPTANLPFRGSKYAAGLDLFANETKTIQSNSSALVSTGISMVIPHGYYGRIAPRSGFSVKTGLMVNAGVIDSDYRGEVKILFANPTTNSVQVNSGEKVAQIVVERIALLDVEEVDSLEESERGANGFGSTDTFNKSVSQN